MTPTSPLSHDSEPQLHVHLASGDPLDVREFQVEERMNDLFEITISALSDNHDIDFEAVAGQAMTFTVHKDTGDHGARTWTGICRHIEQIEAEQRGASTYRLVLVPRLWLLTQRRNHRMFQRESEVDIVKKLLAEWGVAHRESLTLAYKKREYRVQYAETDFAFLRRMLEDAGVSFYFDTDGAETTLVLSDAPERRPPREPPIALRDNPTVAAREHATRVRFGRSIRPGKYTVRDHDHRRPPAFDLKGAARFEGGVESSLEQFDYRPGAFVFESDKGDVSPAGDDRGRYRTDDREAALMADRRLAASRASARTITFDTNVIDLGPGEVVSFLDHPKSELAPGKGFLVTAHTLRGERNGEWTGSCEAVSAGAPYCPPVVTPRPRTSGVESATVVGPGGEEIHTDELGRVRVHFHWDRESRMDERSSCWIHVSQPWGGSGFGGTALPRVGQEVIVDFLSGDPDRPVITGRLYTGLQTTPYKLPENRTQSGLRSRSSPGGGAENYNEVMFEDKKGQELLRMQAEKDLHKLVKNDEAVKIGRDREKNVGRDDALVVGQDRTREVGRDESVTIGHDRTRMVANNESVTIGNSRTKSVAVNEGLFVGANQSEQIGGNRSVKVKKNHTEKIGKAKSIKVGRTKTEFVALASTETVGLAKALTVGAAYQITVGALMNTTVGMNQSTSVSMSQTNSVTMDQVNSVALNQTNAVGGDQEETIGKTKKVTVADKVEITCGKSKVVMEKKGKITWSIDGGGQIVLEDKDITIQAGDGGNVVIIGGPDVHVNP